MPNPKKHIFDNPNNVKRVLRSLYVICFILFILDFVINRHISHSLEKIWGFHALYGFVGCVVLVLVAKGMRIFLMRSEDYYTKSEKIDKEVQHVDD